MAGKKLGPRATVLFKTGQGKGQGAKSQYVYMLRSVAEKLGFTVVKDASVTRKSSKSSKAKQSKIAVRGSFGAKSIKVLHPGSNSASKKNVRVKFLSVPVPGDATISDIKAFLSRASKKPKSFVSPHGRTYPLDS